MKRKLILATGNPNKVDEMKKILAEFPIEVLSKDDIGLKDIDVEEDGTTFEENSIKKAKAISEFTNYMVLSDDSGLSVDSLNGGPGVYSKRYGGEEGNSHKNNLKLLKEMKNIDTPNRGAKFVSVIALITEDKRVITVRGEVKGQIGYEMKGNNGFGYDPLFIPEGYNNTFGELDEEIKNKISHRARALEEIKKVLIELFEGEDNEEDNSSK